MAKPFQTQISDTKAQDPSIDFILFLLCFNSSFEKEAEIKILRGPKMEHAGRTQRLFACLGGEPK